MAHKFLGETGGLDQKMRPAIVRICKAFHESVRVYSEKFKQDLGRHNYLTPTSYLELLATFQSLLLVGYRPLSSSICESRVKGKKIDDDSVGQRRTFRADSNTPFQ